MSDWLFMAGLVCGAAGFLGAAAVFWFNARAQAAVAAKEPWNRCR